MFNIRVIIRVPDAVQDKGTNVSTEPMSQTDIRGIENVYMSQRDLF